MCSQLCTVAGNDHLTAATHREPTSGRIITQCRNRNNSGLAVVSNLSRNRNWRYSYLLTGDCEMALHALLGTGCQE